MTSNETPNEADAKEVTRRLLAEVRTANKDQWMTAAPSLIKKVCTRLLELEEERRKVFHAILGDEHPYSEANNMPWLAKNLMDNFKSLQSSYEALGKTEKMLRTSLIDERNALKAKYTETMEHVQRKNTLIADLKAELKAANERVKMIEGINEMNRNSLGEAIERRWKLEKIMRDIQQCFGVPIAISNTIEQALRPAQQREGG